jgi:hypothetical protein
MAIERDPEIRFPVTTYVHYSECEPWCSVNLGEWSVNWWRDFPDMTMTVLGQVPQPDTYWFRREEDAVFFRLKFA